MKNRMKLSGLLLVGGLVLFSIVTASSYSYFGNGNNKIRSTVSVNSCAKIVLQGNNSIKVTNASPISDNAALNTTPYSFSIKGNCSDTDFKIYLVSLEGNTLEDSNIKFALTPRGSKTILKSGSLSVQPSAINDFNIVELKEIKTGIGANYTEIYSLYFGFLNKNKALEYDLYLWIDQDVESTDTMQKTFTVALAIKDV